MPLLSQKSEKKRLGEFSPISPERELQLLDQVSGESEKSGLLGTIPEKRVQPFSGISPERELEILDQIEAEEVKAQEHGIFGELGAGLGRGALRVAATPAYLADVVGEAVGWKGLERAGEAGAEKVEKYIEESPRLRKSVSISGDIRDNPQLWTDPRWYASLIGEGAPTIASMIIPGMAAARVAKVAGMGAKAIQAARMGGALTAGMGLEAGGAAEDIRQYEKRTGKQIPIGKKLQTVAGTGVVAGSLEAVPIFNLFGRTVAKKLIGRIITSMIGEGGTEGAQEIVANAFAKAGYDADRDMVGGVIESVVGGVLLGGGMGVMQQTFHDRIKNTDPDEVANLLEQAEREGEATKNFVAMINEGLTKGEINNRPYTPEMALADIQEAYTDKSFTDEDIDAFKEKYPDLRPGLNDLIGENVKDKINAEIEATKKAKKEAEEAYHRSPEGRQAIIDAEMEKTKKEALEAEKIIAERPELEPTPIESTVEVAREPVGVEKKATEKVEKLPWEGKQGWEMTKSEIGEKHAFTGEVYDHEGAIKQALKEGKKVPENVLAEYPDLKPVKEVVAEKVEVKEPWKTETKLKDREYQEKYPEQTVSETWDKANSPRYIFENAGDILREFQKKDQDPFYVNEKMGRVKRFIEGHLDNTLHFDDSLEAAIKHEPERLNKLISQYESQPVSIESQKIAKSLLLNIMKGSFKEAENNLNTIENNIGKWTEQALKPQPLAVEARPSKVSKEVAPLPRTEDLEGEGIGEGTSKRPKVEVGGKFYVPENKSSIEITKDYGKGTPKEDYPGMYRMDMSGWVEVTDLETGDKFPITRNDLVELGIEPTKAKKPEKEKVDEAFEASLVKAQAELNSLAKEDFAEKAERRKSLEAKIAAKEKAEVTPEKKIAQVPTKSLSLDPTRFQFKRFLGKGGVSSTLKSISKYNPDLGGIISVWRDPSDNKTYVVNGHHRYELAKRTGQKDLTVNYLDAANAGEAKFTGALINIAEGQGTPEDAAVIFRKNNVTPEEIEKKYGISLKGKIAQEGMALSGLSPEIFEKVELGEFSRNWGVVIGEKLRNDFGAQNELAKLIKREGKKKHISTGIIEQIINDIQGIEKRTETQETLFGDEIKTRPLLIERAELRDYAINKLLSDKRLFGIVSKEEKATRLRKAGNIITPEENKKLSEEAGKLATVLNQLASHKGPINDTINEYAKELANGINKTQRDATKQSFFESVQDAIRQEVPGIQKEDHKASVRYGEGREADTGKTPEQVEGFKPKPKLLGGDELIPKVKSAEKTKLAALDKVERQATSKFEQDSMFEPNQQSLFGKPAEKAIPPRPLVNPKASALKQDKQLRAQQAWDKKYGEKPTDEKEPSGVRDEKAFATKATKPQDTITRKYETAKDIKSFITTNYGTKFTTAKGKLKGGHTYTEVTTDGKLLKSRIQLAKNSQNDIDTILHEFGHLIDEAHKDNLYRRMFRAEGLNSMSPELPQYRKIYANEMSEIKKVGVERGVLKEHMDEMPEALAEFVRIFSVDRNLAQSLAPQTTKSFEKVIAQDEKLADFFDVEKQFSTTTKPQKTITRKDLRRIFKRMKHIRTGQDSDGNLWFKAEGRPKITIFELDNITGHLNTSAGQIPVGSFLRNTIELKTGGKGYTADIGTAYHEFFHWLSKNGIISANDITALNRVIAKARGISESNVTEEHRADYVGDNISAWETQKHPRIRRILRKLTDFMNAIYDFAAQAGWVKGRERTAEGVIRDIESGRILKEKKEALAGVNEFAQAVSFSLKKAVKAVTDNPNFVKWFGDTEHHLLAEEDGEPRVMYRGMSQRDFDIGIIDSRKKGAAVAGYFTNLPEGAQQYANRILEGDGVVKEFYVAAENVFNDRELTSLDEAEQKFIEKETGQTIDDLDNDVLPENKKLIKALKELGYDAIETEGNYPHTEICPFESTQIKSIYNTGKFGLKEKDIMFQMAGEKAIGAPTKSQISTAYQKLSGGDWNVRVRLSDLRSELNIPHAELDSALKEMQLDNQLVLMSLDPFEVRKTDKEAAIDVGGDPTHIVYMREGKVFATKGGYKERLKEWHTTPLVDETVDKTKIKHFDNLEKTSSQPDWIKDKFGREEKTLKEKIGDNVGAFRKNWQTRLLDRLHPIKALGETAYMLHRLETGAQATMAMFMRHGKLKWEGKALTIDTQKQGFMPWLDSLGDDAQKLFYWMAAKRAEVLETEGREKWLDTDTRKKIFDWVGEKPKSAKSWRILNNQFQDFNKSVLNLAQQSGLINPIKRAAWEQEFYVPFYRIFEDAVAREEFLKGPLMGKKHISAQIKRLLGAEMKIGDPLENVIRNWSHLIHESVRNMARSEAYDYAQKNKLIPLIETVKASELNIYRSDKEKRMVYVTKKGDDNILSFQKNGRRVYFKVNDIEMFNALSDVNHRQFNGFLVRACGQAKRWLTYGATFGPAFKVANMLRDSLHTAIISKSFIPFIDSGKGIVKALREDADYVKFMASGAGFGSSYIRAENPQALAEYINRIVKKEGEGAAQRILDTPKKMLDFWEKLGAASENAARVQLYTKRIAEGETHLKAAFEGRDLMDFTMRGDSQVVQFLIRTVPFMNARAQGLYKLGRAAKQDPKSFMIKGSILTIATLALWAMNRDKDEWKELEDWDKRTYYHFWIGDKHYRIPKPFETGAIFSTVFEGMAEVLSGDEEFGYFVDVMKDTFLDTFAMNPIPQAIRPLIEQWSNKSFFTGRPIEGQSLQRLRPGERKTAWTSETMQLAGKLGVSPKRAEEIIRGYFSTFGMFLLGTSDIFSYHLADFPVNPTKEINDYPLLGRFIKEKDPARHTKYQTKFYETFREIDQLVATINNYKRLGDYKKAVELASKERKNLIKRKDLLEARKQLTETNAKLRIIMNSKTLTAEQKRTKIDKLIEYKNKITKQAYDSYVKEETKKSTTTTPWGAKPSWQKSGFGKSTFGERPAWQKKTAREKRIGL